MRYILATALVVTLVFPLVGQTEQRPPAGDPDIAAKGGVQITGWQARLDSQRANVNNLSFRSMGTGMHVTTGPAAILWQPNTTAKGEYKVTATFTQTKPSDHPNALGIFFGGSDLSGPNQRYTYFVVRETGEFLIKKRNGAETPVVIDWTENAAVNALDAQGRSKNTLSVEVGKDQVRFLVNGKEVAARPRSALDIDGIVGIRINHNLDVHVDSFKVG
jgi:hypothetical protein